MRARTTVHRRAARDDRRQRPRAAQLHRRRRRDRRRRYRLGRRCGRVEPGDVIQKINGKDVAKPQDVTGISRRRNRARPSCCKFGAPESKSSSTSRSRNARSTSGRRAVADQSTAPSSATVPNSIATYSRMERWMDFARTRLGEDLRVGVAPTTTSVSIAPPSR